MGYQSKTWSLSDEVVTEIERRVREMKAQRGKSSPNQVLREALLADKGEVIARAGFVPPNRLPIEIELRQGQPIARDLVDDLASDGAGELRDEREE